MRKLVVISVDSLFTSDLETIKDLPGFEEILEDSIVVKNIECIYPTLTYPCHATIMTGHYPEQHGIHHNEILDPEHANENWYWYYKDLKVKTIFDYAKENGMTTSAVLWPVTAQAPIDYLIPEIWTPEYDKENKKIVETTSPIMKEIYEKHKALLNWKKNPNLDEFGGACLLDIVEAYAPDVLFLHQASLDHARHATGTHSNLVSEAQQLHGQWIKKIIELYKKKGLFEQTTFIVLGDHGQLNIQNIVSINEMFRQSGLIKTDGQGHIVEYEAYMQSAGISGHLYLRNKEVEGKVLEILEEAKNKGYIETIFNKEEAKKLHLTGNFEYVVEGSQGIALSNQVDCEIVQEVNTGDYKYSKATHGHLPVKGDQPPFIIYNSGYPAQVIKSGKLVDEFPTLMKLLDLEIPEGLEGKSFIE